jgi:hypothetical protein
MDNLNKGIAPDANTGLASPDVQREFEGARQVGYDTSASHQHRKRNDGCLRAPVGPTLEVSSEQIPVIGAFDCRASATCGAPILLKWSIIIQFRIVLSC